LSKLLFERSAEKKGDNKPHLQENTESLPVILPAAANGCPGGNPEFRVKAVLCDAD